MAILDTGSLIGTVDAFNQAVFLGLPWKGEARALVKWLGERLGAPRGYAESFALTDEDWGREFRLFTGEPITTRAGRAHIMAQETTRLLAVIHQATGRDCPARLESEERLGARIFDREKSTATRDGMYCCGPCSIAFWRCVAAGGYARQPDIMPLALVSLARHRDGKGGWRRFPFYYTLSLLAELGPRRAGEEIDYCSRNLERRRLMLERRADRFSSRRLKIVERLSRDR
jgi:hypothetical protein